MAVAEFVGLKLAVADQVSNLRSSGTIGEFVWSVTHDVKLEGKSNVVVPLFGEFESVVGFL
jgi:hypothetical protein